MQQAMSAGSGDYNGRNMEIARSVCFFLLALLLFCRACASESVDTQYFDGVDGFDVSEDGLDMLGQSEYEKSLELLNKGTATHLSLARFREVEVLLHAAATRGHGNAALELVRLYFFGRAPDAPPNYEKAAAALDLKGCQRHAECHTMRALMLDNGLGMERNVRHALMYYGLGAKGRSRAALRVLAWRSKHGIGMPKSCSRARDFYFPVISSLVDDFEKIRVRTFPKLPALFDSYVDGNQESTQVKLDSMQGDSPQDLVDYYAFNAEDNAESLLFLGQIYYLGLADVPRDFAMARHYFSLARSAGSFTALAHLGQMDYYGEGIDAPEYRRAFRLFRRSARAGSGMGYNGMGLFYRFGHGEVVPDLMEAKRNFEKAASLDFAEGAFNLAQVLREINNGVSDDAVFNAYVNSFRGGHVPAGLELAWLHMTRPGSCPMTLYILQSIDAKSPSDLMVKDAVQLYHANLVSFAYPRLLFAAEQGVLVAQQNLAFMLDREARKLSDQSAKDSMYRRAMQWWMAASHESNQARLRVGDHYYYGRGVYVDYPSAAAYYYSAGGIEGSEDVHLHVPGTNEPKPLDGGNLVSVQAIFNMGWMHQFGMGIPKDLQLAERYYGSILKLSQSAKRGAYSQWAWIPVVLMLRVMDLSESDWTLFLKLAMAVFVILVTLLVMWYSERRGRHQAGYQPIN